MDKTQKTAKKKKPKKQKKYKARQKRKANNSFVMMPISAQYAFQVGFMLGSYQY